MKTQERDFESILADGIHRFLIHKRALGRRFDVEEKTLRLFDRFLVVRGISRPEGITSDVIDSFLASRPRHRPRSFNHLLGTVRRLFDWLVVHRLAATSPVRAQPRRQTSQRVPFIFDRAGARRLLEHAAGLPDNSRTDARTDISDRLRCAIRPRTTCGRSFAPVLQGRRLRAPAIGDSGDKILQEPIGAVWPADCRTAARFSCSAATTQRTVVAMRPCFLIRQEPSCQSMHD